MRAKRVFEKSELIKKLFEEFFLNPEVGTLVHRKAKGLGPTRTLALTPVGNIDHNGYLIVKFCGRKFRVHRIMWAMHYGSWPDGDVDHLDRNPLNNKISNMRIATNSENMKNTGLQSNNTSGFKGISWSKKKRRWVTYIKNNGTRRELGAYRDLEIAVLVRRIAEHCLWGGIHEFQDFDKARKSK